MVLRIAREKTLSHAWQKLLLGLVISLIATAIQYYLRVRSLNDAEKIGVSLIGSAIIVMIGSFLKNLILTPPLVHSEQKSEIEKRNKHIEDLTSQLATKAASAPVAVPDVNPHEQEQRRLVSEKMQTVSQEESKVLEALLRHGEIHRRDVPNLGFSTPFFYSVISKGKMAGLVKEREERHPGGIEQYLSINPTFEPALKQYFAQSQPGLDILQVP